MNNFFKELTWADVAVMAAAFQLSEFSFILNPHKNLKQKLFIKL
jgi:hypothetical protein